MNQLFVAYATCHQDGNTGFGYRVLNNYKPPSTSDDIVALHEKLDSLYEESVTVVVLNWILLPG